jgi:RHS repeat-associated protein
VTRPELDRISRRFVYAPAADAITSPREVGSYVYGSNSTLQETVWLDRTIPVGVSPNGGTGATPSNTLRVFAGHLNEPRRATDQSNNLYWQWDSDPFGVGLANNNPAGHGALFFDLRFPGQSFDAEDNSHWNVTRSYTPATGRYLQSDTIGLAGGINTYAYVLNNPATNVDPTGTCADSDVTCQIAARQAGLPQFATPDAPVN